MKNKWGQINISADARPRPIAKGNVDLTPFIRRVLTAGLLLASVAYAADGAPDATTPDGARYYGALKNGRFEGHGKLEWENGTDFRLRAADLSDIARIGAELIPMAFVGKADQSVKAAALHFFA